MPQAIVPALGAALAGYAAGAAIGTILLNVALAVGSSLLLGALAKKPKAPAFSAQLIDNTLTVRQPAAPWHVVYGARRKGGVIVFLHTTGTDKEFLHIVVVLAAHRVKSIGALYFDAKAVPLDGSGNATGKYAGHVHVEKGLGTDSQAAFAGLVSAAPTKWTANHRLRGHAAAYVRLKWNRDLFPNGLPNLSFDMEGRDQIFDPRGPSTGYSQNAALCLADYPTNTRFGLGGTFAAEIDDTDLIEAANVCDEAVARAGGGTENRYQCNGFFALDESPADLIRGLNSAMSGKAVFVAGKWHIHAGAWRAPTVTLDEDDLRGGIGVKTLVSRREAINAVKGTYVSATNNWQLSDFPAVTNATYLADDGGERVWGDIVLPFTISPSAAQRLAKILLEQSRQEITVATKCKLTAYQNQAGDVVDLVNARMGWPGKAFEVKDSTLAAIGAGDAPALGVDLTLRETAAAVYDWNSGEETQVDLAPNTTLPDPFTVAAPGAPELTEVTYQTREGGGVKAKAVLAWAASPDAFLDAYQPEFKLASASPWILLPRTAAATIDILDITPGLYDFRVKALNTLGVSSNYTSASNREVFGLLAPPAALSNLTLVAVGGMALLRWDRHPDLDVRVGGKIAFRHSQAQAGATWQTSVSIGDPVDGADTVVVLPLKPGTYLAKAIDSSGVPSASAVGASTKGAQVLAFANLNTIDEHPTFVGSHSGTVADSGKLKLAGAGSFDAIADLDLVVDLDANGGVAASGTYDFAAGIDLASVKLTRLRSDLTVSIVNVLDKIDDRAGSLDDWEDFDGAVTGSGDAQVWVRETDDDPAGAPTWSAYHRLDAAEYQARGFDFQARLSVDDPAYNIQVSALTVTADEVV